LQLEDPVHAFFRGGKAAFQNAGNKYIFENLNPYPVRKVIFQKLIGSVRKI
jgi:hypothetical protein